MNKVVRICFLMLIGGTLLSSVNAMSLQDIRKEEAKMGSLISGLRKTGPQLEALNNVISKLEASCEMIKNGISSIAGGQDRRDAGRALGRLKTDLLFLKAIRAYKENPETGREALMSFGRSDYTYQVLTEEICGDIGEF